MAKNIVGRVFLILGLLILVALFSYEVFAEDLNIVEVRKNIPLSDEDPVYKDFYINAGTDSGLKKHQVVTAFRKISVRDATGTQSFGDIMVPVGQLKIIALQNKISIAREYKLISREDEPMLEQIGLMSGDRISLEGSFIDNKKASAKKSE